MLKMKRNHDVLSNKAGLRLNGEDIAAEAKLSSLATGQATTSLVGELSTSLTAKFPGIAGVSSAEMAITQKYSLLAFSTSSVPPLDSPNSMAWMLHLAAFRFSAF